ncbi:MAG: hypothetical protein OXG53_06140 [Chloroflexi bacterium]|nr:hypothetical protein [Chloroflexota bacterium]
MVDALSEARRALKPGGRLIDLRPTMRNRSVELELPSATLFIGEIDSASTFPDHVAADAALDAALAAREFRLEHQTTFHYLSDLDSLADLREFKRGLRRSVMPESIFERIETLTANEDGHYLIRIRREMLIARYRRL